MYFGPHSRSFSPCIVMWQSCSLPGRQEAERVKGDSGEIHPSRPHPPDLPLQPGSTPNITFGYNSSVG